MPWEAGTASWDETYDELTEFARLGLVNLEAFCGYGGMICLVCWHELESNL